MSGGKAYSACQFRQFAEPAPSQAHWPTERAEVIRAAVADWRTWPDQLESGVMFYMGERITRAEFEATRSQP